MIDHRAGRGFTLVEMAVTVLIFGMLLAFGVPAIQSMNKTQQLKGTTENVAAWLRLQREKAIATGDSVVVHSFAFPGVNGDLHIHNPGRPILPGPKFARGVSYWSAPNVTFLPSGRARTSGRIILRNTRGLRDTIAFQVSGLVMVR
jgi:prepilin-type N-terminal cleavage/methylation domain-containing protein